MFYEVYGDGAPTVLFLPAWSVVPSRHWKFQLPYFGRHMRAVTFDGRGSGRSDRPAGVEAYMESEFALDALAVLDATGTERAVLVGVSCGALWGAVLAADHPDRVSGAVFIAPSVSLSPPHPERAVHPFNAPLDTEEGWAKYNSHYWRRDAGGFLEFFFSKCFTESHSTKQIEDCVGWGVETSPEVLIDSTRALFACGAGGFPELCTRIGCPVLVVHGDADAIRPYASGVALAELTGGTLATFRGSGHLPHARDPVRMIGLLRDFVESLSPGAPRARTGTRALSRARRALYVSSPIGLGHARRDLAIAHELRRLVPDLEVDWLAQHPVTSVLEAEGERIHPASAHLANESEHIEAESRSHDLHAFQAIRRMDEILCANFMVFRDLVREQQYDLWIGDEAWEVDHFLHENPEEKRAPYVWLADFVGWLPMPDGGEREAFLTADYNAEMIEHVARFPRVRDLSIFVGDADDIVPDRFGPGLPSIREWTERHFGFAGYVTGFDQARLPDREALRAELGYRPDERVCIATVGGSGVGGDLLRRVIAAFPEAKRRVPALRMVVVAGPRIDPASLPDHDGIEVRAYVHDLYRHLAACDLAVVQGGLTTTMELTASRRPFLYFPLRHHFEQNFHVRHRLERYRSGRAMDFGRDGPEQIAAAIEEEIGRHVDCRHVTPGGARRAAEAISRLV